MSGVQLDFLFNRKRREPPSEDWLPLGAQRVRLCFVKNRKARRYILRLGSEGCARVTIPRGGSLSEARNFAGRHAGWLAKQLLRRAAARTPANEWFVGTEILFRGELVRLEAAGGTAVRCAAEVVPVGDATGDVRSAVERHLRRLAAKELPPVVFEFAGRHNLQVNRVSVRNQRTRWGSCSRRGQISLNWRLVQTPVSVRDYIVLHELAHLKEMNHSRRFWAEVARLCPEFAQAERWLKANPGLLG